MPFQPVDTQRLYQQVADQISELIRVREFPVGHRLLPERDLAKALGVSRPVVREAMIALEIAGLVEVRTGSGTYVKARAHSSATRPLPIILDDVGPSPFDIISARVLLEGEVAFLAAKEATDEDLKEIATIHREMSRQMAAGEATQDLDRQFHERIARATHNTVLPTLVEGLWTNQFAPVFSVLSQRTGLSENRAATLASHGRIAEALMQRDPASARAAMHAHLEQVLAVLMRDDETT
ncbi:FadR/GntR family transcriptional regulator [Telmatospirillum siberiense]|uniref:FadR family transcriptional regulator n=1 Tax=Telmatospirillum siberiense TaxID=382514 RepID=A0A2N3PXX4_9PROT|nr:FadR/GntR family transcriptional regulator [Telmatospirillum siberiense]PKU25262.1 FadR family transcriptional regulator [Telmatospirillum siberiense]